jgi:hypothetical protein
VAVGTKFLKKVRSDNRECVQFFVKKKRRRGLSRRLPAFMWGRRANGRIDRRFRFKTDVIEVGSIRAACGGGSAIVDVGEKGAMTLLFRNRRTGDTHNFYLITCGHVVGDFQTTHPPNHRVNSACCPAVSPMAQAVLSSVHQGGRIDYDVALARLEPAAVQNCALEDRRITGSNAPLTRFQPRKDITPGMFVRCRFPVSLIAQSTVDSFAGWVTMECRGREFEVNNAFVLQAGVRPGDSGGIIYQGDRAIGILFARSSTGWAWFHPLGEAVAHLNSLNPSIQIEVF